jgi:hypothetical protein
MHFLQEESGHSATVKMGITLDESLKDEIAVTVIATGFEGYASDKNPVMETEQRSPIIESYPLINQETDDIIIEDLNDTSVAMPPIRSNDSFDSPAMMVPNSASSPELTPDISEIFRNFETDEKPAPITHTNVQAQPAIPTRNEIPQARQTEIPVRVNMGGNKQRVNHVGIIHDNDMNIPAYKRRNIELASAPASTSSHVEKLNISQRADGGAEPTFQFTPNKMLHDNVD